MFCQTVYGPKLTGSAVITHDVTYISIGWEYQSMGRNSLVPKRPVIWFRYLPPVILAFRHIVRLISQHSLHFRKKPTPEIPNILEIFFISAPPSKNGIYKTFAFIGSYWEMVTSATCISLSFSIFSSFGLSQFCLFQLIFSFFDIFSLALHRWKSSNLRAYWYISRTMEETNHAFMACNWFTLV